MLITCNANEITKMSLAPHEGAYWDLIKKKLYNNNYSFRKVDWVKLTSSCRQMISNLKFFSNEISTIKNERENEN